MLRVSGLPIDTNDDFIHSVFSSFGHVRTISSSKSNKGQPTSSIVHVSYSKRYSALSTIRSNLHSHVLARTLSKHYRISTILCWAGFQFVFPWFPISSAT